MLDNAIRSIKSLRSSTGDGARSNRSGKNSKKSVPHWGAKTQHVRAQKIVYAKTDPTGSKEIEIQAILDGKI